MRKIVLWGLLIIVISSGLGFIVWHKYFKSSAATLITNSDKKENKPEIPKISEYQVPILMYHYIRNADGESELGKNLSVSPDNFAAQLAWLKESGYTTIKMADLADPERTAVSKAYFENKKPIILTFDDGYEDAYTQAFPTLGKYGFIGTFYIIRSYVGGGNYMNQAQINELAKAGMEIGSHSLSHPNLTVLSLADLKKQIDDSKEQTTTFCYPLGKYNDQVITKVEEAGYSTAVTTRGGIANQESNLFELPRVRIENGGGDYLTERIKSYE